MYEFLDRITIVKGDITQMADVDAIVCGVYPDLALEGSLFTDVVKAAGTDLDAFILENIYKPRTGDAFVVPSFGLPVKHIIFMVRPRWRDGFFDEDKYLQRGYRSVMEQAQMMSLRAIAVATIGTATKQFPVQRVARLALQGIADRQTDLSPAIRIVCHADDTFDAFTQQLAKMIAAR